jgi:hypothetical protein
MSTRSGTIPSTWRRSASFEDGEPWRTSAGDIDNGWRAYSPFEIGRTTERGGAPGFGDGATRIITNGGTDGCSCPRYTMRERLRLGSEVWLRGAWLIPEPQQLSNYSRLMGVNYWVEGDPRNYSTSLVVPDAGIMQVQTFHRAGADDYEKLSRRFPIPANRWFTVHLHLRLSNMAPALTELYVDGELVSSSTGRNLKEALDPSFANFGLPYFAPGPNATVYFDAPGLTR